MPKYHSLLSDPVSLSRLLEPMFYYAVFSHPLSLEEIWRFSALPVTQRPNLEELKVILSQLVQKGWLYQFEEYYLVENNRNWVERRIKNQQRAQEFLVRAHQIVPWMSCFPFVRAIFISGSLSKQVMPADGDIDYFIITKANRLWIARTCLILFKKLFLFNSHKYFCVNYLIDENTLEIEEKNRFTATEIATLLPMHGANLYQQFWNDNNWTNQYYPSAQPQDCPTKVSFWRRGLQRMGEFLFLGAWGNWLDAYLMRKTKAVWQKKFKHLPDSDFSVGLKSNKTVSKHHPQLFQKRVLNAFTEQVQKFEERHSISLDIALQQTPQTNSYKDMQNKPI